MAIESRQTKNHSVVKKREGIKVGRNRLYIILKRNISIESRVYNNDKRCCVVRSRLLGPVTIRRPLRMGVREVVMSVGASLERKWRKFS